MEISISKRKENRLLSREEITGTVVFSGATPSYDQFRKSLSAQIKVPEDTIAIPHIYTSFGSSSGTFEARVYASKELLAKIEPKKKEKKAKPGEGAEEAKPEAKPAEAK